MSVSAFRLCSPLLFKLEPEYAHHLVLKFAQIAEYPGVKRFLQSWIFSEPDPRLAFTSMGLRFKSPVWIAAGLDKNCEAVAALSTTGVGAIELGTVTPEPQAGNPAPRMFRFQQQRSVINRLGFPSCGIKVFRSRLEKVRRGDVVIGINIGKNKDTPIESCESDYERCATELCDLADYLAINVSSPNTPGLRALQTPEMLSRVIRAVQFGNSHSRPVVVKISPDCTETQFSELVGCCKDERISGIVATNTTLSRPSGFKSLESGGLSGELLKPYSRNVIGQICELTRGSDLAVIGAGGVACAEDVIELKRLGCVAAQLYTALVFDGPGLISHINRQLLKSSRIK